MTKQIQSDAASQAVPCLLIPTQGKSLLLPNVTVAEVVGYTEPRPLENAPAWFLGFMFWRGEQIPVLSYELANQEVQVSKTVSARIAVMNGSGTHNRLPFFAVVVQGIPRMVRVGSEDVEQSQENLGPAEAMAVKTALGKAYIPNLPYLESLLTKVI
ncbi:chemotaxis protein CheW [Gynuella sunshinyii]|uniref:Chemotaxis signal transduction protein n=1 Tax=Gynuella sunshinyii YC6258 TaxID=1445510 RepID=A0A0C5V1Q2_9GAMM|nr:chemotaxis protein CheW [Gynuella sunshinyii]AJQ93480.1 chemotaxis signal transduction protein [Gynuella sunshinyii YC6258]